MASTSKKKPFVAQLSRRVKACDECRKHKIKCDLSGPKGGDTNETGEPPCKRCTRLGLHCHLTKSLQSILEERSMEDNDWRGNVERRLDILSKAIVSLTQVSAPPDEPSALHEILSDLKLLGTFKSEEDHLGRKRHRSFAPSSSVSVASSPANHMNSENLGLLADAASENYVQTWGEEGTEADPASAPGQHLKNLGDEVKENETLLHPEHGEIQQMTNEGAQRHPIASKVILRRKIDIIDRGIVTLSQAKSLLDIYLEHLDLQVFSIVRQAHQHPGLQQARCENLDYILSSIRHSPLLLCAICAVAALHCKGKESSVGQKRALDEEQQVSGLYHVLHDEFVRNSAQQSFIRRQSFDDIRALVIASWWLRDLSWILTASAVRLATERGMQEAYKRCSSMKKGQSSSFEVSSEHFTEAYEAARLYYLVYVADHQAGIPFSRPPMTRQHAAVRNARSWLASCPISSEEDVRLIAQVEIWVIAHDVVDDFGVDSRQELSRTQVLDQVPRALALLSNWQRHWTSIFGDQNLAIEEVQVEAAMMRLFLCAHIFRAPKGVSPLLIESEGTDPVRNDSSNFDHSLDQRGSFINRALPDFAGPVRDEQKYRYNTACEAVAAAHQVIDMFCSKKSPKNTTEQRQVESRILEVFGQPIYPHVMLIFSILFLEKLSRTYGVEAPAQIIYSKVRLAISGCQPDEVFRKWEDVSSLLQSRIVRFCAPEHLCVGALAGLRIILKRKHEKVMHNSSATSHSSQGTYSVVNANASTSSELDKVLDPQNKTTKCPQSEYGIPENKFSDPAIFSDEGMLDLRFGKNIADHSLSPYNFDLQSLDLLSDTRFLSGVGHNIEDETQPWGWQLPSL